MPPHQTNSDDIPLPRANPVKEKPLTLAVWKYWPFPFSFVFAETILHTLFDNSIDQDLRNP